MKKATQAPRKNGAGFSSITKGGEYMAQRRWLRHSSLAVVSLVGLGLLAGCGDLGAIGLSANKNPPFKNELGLMVVTPSSSFNPQTAPSAIYSHVSVLTATGKKVTLNAKNQPLLFEAYWCPHCQRTLVALNKNKSQLKRLPFFVSEGFVPGTKLTQAIQLTRQEFSYFHFSGFQVYYIINSHEVAKNAPNGFPTLAFVSQGQMLTLTGEHMLSVWKAALNQAK